MGSKQRNELWDADSAEYRKGMEIQRVMFCFWTVDGAEGYVLAQKPYPHTTYHVRILGKRYVRWVLPGHMTVPELKKRIGDYFDQLGSYR